MRTLGQIFRETRESKGMSASQAAEATRIKPQMLDRMEADVWTAMPAPIYARGFIKIYAEVLGMDPQPLIDSYGRWTHSDRKRAPFIGEDSSVPVPAPTPVIPVPHVSEPQNVPRPVVASPTPLPPSPSEEKQPEPVPVAASAPPRPATRPRPAFVPATGPVFAGMGRFLKYLPIGLVMILAVVLLFSALKRWGRFSSDSSALSPATPAVRSPGSSGTASSSTSGNKSSGLTLAEEPPATYFDDTP